MEPRDLNDPDGADDEAGRDVHASAAAALSPDGPTMASVPFMITRRQREALRLAGASEDEIRHMRPQDVAAFLAGRAEPG